jgi:S-(hydroxymethyl)glutathione dehydrogenase/alcohol dehydrogenase
MHRKRGNKYSHGCYQPYREANSARQCDPAAAAFEVQPSSSKELGRMKTTAAILWGPEQKWQIEEVDLDEPKAGEVLVQLTASGLCHSDHHLVTGDIPVSFPIVGGHEGAGVIAGVGPGVTQVEEGDSVVLSFLPACGHCSYCARGMTNLCDLGAAIILGPQLDGSYRFHSRGENVGQMCLLGTFAEYTVVPVASVVKVDRGTPLDKAALIGCGVPTGYGSVVNTAEVRPGDSVVVMGIGGIGINAVQGARAAGARHIVAIDPVEFKRQKAVEFGATHTVTDTDAARTLINDLTRGQMADACVITTDVAEGRYTAEALSLVGKRGKVIVTAIGHPSETTVTASLFEMTLYEKSVHGALFGSSNPQHDIPRYLEMYNLGELKLDELVTKEYALEDINEGYQDMLDGRNIRGLIRF